MEEQDVDQDLILDAEFRNSKGAVVAKPVVEGLVADTHCHLDMLARPGLALARCSASNVQLVVTVVETSENAEHVYDMLAEWLGDAMMLLDSWRMGAILPTCKVVAGCHPQLSASYDADVEKITRLCARHPLTVAIGEVGLDYYYDEAPHDVQARVFRKQIEIANEAGKPIVMHIRDAHDDALKILEKDGIPEAGALLHCFTNDYDTLQPFLELGCYVAFGGALTFGKSDAIREAARRAPLDRIVTETDSPYMSPVPLRGTPCSPENTVFTADFLAKTREVAAEDRPAFFDAIYKNAFDVFHLESYI